MNKNWLLGLIFAASAAFAQHPAKPLPVLDIGYLQTPDQPKYAAFLNDSVKSISEALAGRYLVRPVPFSPDSLRQALAEKKVHYFFSNSLFYLSVSASSGPNSSSRLAVLWHPKSVNPTYSMGSAVVVRKNAPIQSLRDLQNKEIAVSSLNDMETIGAFRGEILKEHLPAEGFLDHFVPESSYNAVAEAVLSGKVQAGILPACYAEDRPHDLKLRDLKVIDAKHQDKLACKTSTDLYLGPVFASAYDADPHLNRLIVQALLNTPATDGFLWTPGGDLSAAHELFKSLGEAQYGTLFREFVIRFLEDKAPIISALALALLLLIIHWWRVNKLVDKRTRQLRALQAEADEVQDKLERMQSVGVVGLMSSTLSHELKQPLGVIGNYIQGLEFLIRSGRLSPEGVSEALNQIKNQIRRTNEIVQKVRDYAKRRDKNYVPLNLTEIVKESVSYLKIMRKEPVLVSFKAPGIPVMVEGDATEIQLAVYNLLKNAAEACEKAAKPEIDVTLGCSDGKAVLSITDNGPKVKSDEISKMTQPLWTSKETGMGLGIPIVRQIAESHRGSLIFDTLKDGTLLVQLVIPLFKKRHD